MKKLITAIILLTAFNAKAELSPKEQVELCSYMGTIAEVIMTQRQLGTPITEMLETSVKNASSPAIMELTKRMTIHAYDHARLESQDAIDKTVADFRNGYELACIKDFNK